MLTFTYTARDPATGEKIKAEVQSDSLRSAAKLIKDQGYAPIDIEQKKDASTGFISRKQRIKTKDKVLFSRQLATLINAGLPLLQSLKSIENQTQNKAFAAIINKMVNDVEGGKSFSEALLKHPTVFDRIFISMIEAGETSGTLDQSLERLSIQQEKDADTVAKIRGAMIYPLIVMVVMLGVVVFMLTTVLPQVKVLYDGVDGGQQLPIFTRMLLFVSDFIIRFWPVIIALLGTAVFFGTRWFRTIAGRSLADKLKMTLWPVKGLFMKVYMARFARTGSTLVASGVPLIKMLEVTAASVDNVHIEASVARAITKVKGGTALSVALEGDVNFLRLVPDMLKIGEQSGTIEKMLAKTADYYEKEVDNEVKNISNIVEPVMMVILGAVAFIIVAAVLLPIYSLVGKNVIK